ncbi:2Fe-2S iron-sulfur cluster-binding protein [Streptomyces sp. NPDC051907]|uniref:2Fe-2S iron-sulfur cluster-binding protein n=1 Tax=Streptomyces sp. NPDC051907 TaxID=3155284 RepID=UPI00341AE1E6
MSDDENQETPQGHGGWQPTPQGGEYDAEATAFLQLPPEGALDAAPLEAPGHGYVPPMINPLTPAASVDPDTAAWMAQHQDPQYQVPHQQQWPEPAPADPQATGQWTFSEAAAPEQVEPAQTGQWSIPVADGELPEESGEYAASSLREQWESQGASGTNGSTGTIGSGTLGGGAPAAWTTLPGGATAPWATTPQEQQPEPHPQDRAQQDLHEPQTRREPHEPHEPESTGAAQPTPVAGAESVPLPPARDASHDLSQHDPSQHGSAADSVQEAAGETAAESGVGAGVESAVDARVESGAEAGVDAGLEAGAELGEGAEAPSAAAPTSSTGSDEHPPTSYVLRVNGTDRPVTDAWIGESLLYVLRERLGLAGAKDGCSQGECGACNVQVDGRLVASCLVPAATAAGSEVRTVEGLAADGEPSDVQRALAGCGAVQCGFCIPGMAMTVHDLLEGNHAPTELETRQALCGNLCRCSGYRGVLDAVREVVAEREASAAAAVEAAQQGGQPGGRPGEEARIPHQAPPGAGSVQLHPHDGGMA